VLAALVAAASATADPSVTAKRAQAAGVVTQIQQLDGGLERAVERYNLANVRLAETRRKLQENRHELKVAKTNLKRSQRALQRRLVSLYTSDQTSTLEVVLGAKSLDEVLTSMDSAKSVSTLDTHVLRQVHTFRTAVARRGRSLAAARASQQRLVSTRAAQRASIEAQLAQRHRLLASIHGQIAQLEARDRARSLAMARQARARLADQQQQQHQIAEETVVGVTAVAPEGTTVAPPPTHGGVVGAAMSRLGSPYVWGAGGPSTFDCSGLVMWAFAQIGVSMPHSTYAQYTMGSAVSRDQLQPGDLVFFDGLGHVGIYIGGGQFVHAPHTGDVVKVSSLSDSWYASTYVGARRI
jgi:cell wall-associated NlpC family hydrolase